MRSVKHLRKLNKLFKLRKLKRPVDACCVLSCGTECACALSLHLHNAVAVDGAAVLTDVHAHRPDGAHIGGKADGWGRNTLPRFSPSSRYTQSYQHTPPGVRVSSRTPARQRHNHSLALFALPYISIGLFITTMVQIYIKFSRFHASHHKKRKKDEKVSKTYPAVQSLKTSLFQMRGTCEVHARYYSGKWSDGTFTCFPQDFSGQK